MEKTHKIYCMLPAADTPAPLLSQGRRAEGRVDLRERTAEGRAGPDVLREADRLVLAEHGPPGAIIDDELNMVQVRGRTAPYLELSPGEPTRISETGARRPDFGSGKGHPNCQANQRPSQ